MKSLSNLVGNSLYNYYKALFVTLTLSHILVHLNLICLMEAALGLGMSPNWLADE